MLSSPHLDHNKDVRRRVCDAEASCATESGDVLICNVLLQHLLDGFLHHVEIEVLGDFLLLPGIVESHAGKDWLNLQLKPDSKEI